MNETEFEQEIKKHYQQLYGNPPNAEQTWRQVAPHLMIQKHQKPWWKHVFRKKQAINGSGSGVDKKHLPRRQVTRIRVALVILVVGLMAIATTTYAATGDPLNDLFNALGVKPIVQQFSDYHQSKSIDGYTITIQKAYADSNRVLIGYTSERPGRGNLNAKFAPGLSKLTTELGTELRQMEGVSNTEDISGNLFIFNASLIQGTPKDLHLHLAIPYGSQPPSSAFQVDGYLTFDFAVPFHPGKVIPINRSVTASGTPKMEQVIYMENGKQTKIQVVAMNGQAITLKQVVISPSETRAYVKLINPPWELFPLSFAITAGGKTYNFSSIYSGSDIWQVNFDDPSLANKKGDLTLTIQQVLPKFNPKTGEYPSAPVPGATWAFHYKVK